MNYTLTDDELFDFFQYLIEQRKEIRIIKWLIALSIPVLIIAVLFVSRYNIVKSIVIGILIISLWLYIVPSLWNKKLFSIYKDKRENGQFDKGTVDIEFCEKDIKIVGNGSSEKLKYEDFIKAIEYNSIYIFLYKGVILPTPLKIGKSIADNLEKCKI